MLDLMYELPSSKNVADSTITRAMVDEHTGGKVVSLTGKDRQQESA